MHDGEKRYELGDGLVLSADDDMSVAQPSGSCETAIHERVEGLVPGQVGQSGVSVSPNMGTAKSLAIRCKQNTNTKGGTVSKRGGGILASSIGVENVIRRVAEDSICYIR